ncbi:pimeloyl-ACP methyl ester carboxylesterase [Hymenobacter luteus]|uniref:Pimeloyl-ACP methyl ester carboxylesterase n=2 Tax=Hymenobacter TaxID=89966 RepID=A0A7W9WDL4_9BACT|nr:MULTISPECIES: alpha/beta fold hydrolase [Hymenobacter]MBB4602610.1 pimeloyl-ACP methyl ester carboxylesterase [Hymenobacter latericoloratus]MBB6060501.1 pimeloyl-ACP methyl ester carboxylesterase [Hymenobacter luteus]
MKTRLHFQKYGTGPRVVLAFHGYGQGEGHWRSLITVLGPEVTVYAFDLFYHGRSKLARTDAPLSKKRLGELLREFLEAEGITRFSLLAFSMGAKFALTAVEQFPAAAEQLWLIAPDGLQRRFWYALATYPPWMRGVLGRAVLRPQRLLRLLDALHQRRLVDANLVRFAQWQLDSREKRLRVYRSWVGFRNLTFDVKKLAATLNRQPTAVTFFLGRYDRVIPHAGLEQFIGSLRRAHTVVLEAGHAGLIYDVAAYLRRHPGLRL